MNTVTGKNVLIAVISVGILSAVLIHTGLLQFSNDITFGSDQKVEYDETIRLASSVMPYSTEVNSTSVVRFVNMRGEPVNVTFETYQIDRTLHISVNGSKRLNLSRYDGLPTTNYFNAGGEIGELVIS